MDVITYALLKNKIMEYTYDDTEIRQKLLKVIEDINVINGNGEGSISKTIADEIAKIIDGAPENLNTLKELSDWINTHSESAADMNSRILQNTNDIAVKFDKNQGSINSGKIAGIDESGEVVPMLMPGVTYNEETQCLEYNVDEKINLNAGIQLDETLSKSGYAADAAKVGELKGDLDELYKNYNLMDFTESKYNSVLNKSGLSISNIGRNSIEMSTSTEQSLLFTFDVEPNTQYEFYVNYNNTGTVNVRLYVDGDFWAMTETKKTYTTKATETSLTVRIYLDANSSINISNIDIREKGKTDGFDTDLIKPFLECHQYAKASNNIIHNTWHVGSISGDGTINTSSTTLRYSNPIKINKGLTYFTSGADKSLASIKFYSTEPDLTASEPIAPIKSYDSCAYFTAEESGHIFSTDLV